MLIGDKCGFRTSDAKVDAICGSRSVANSMYLYLPSAAHLSIFSQAHADRKHSN